METLEQMIERHEGRMLSPYRCPAGKLSIGMGHNIDAKGLPAYIQSHLDIYHEITDGMADDLLRKDIADAEKDCRRLFRDFDSFTIPRHNALVDFVFNVGLGTARKFKKAIAAVNRNDWATAALEMKDSRWYRQVGARSIEICDMVREG